MNKILFVCTGNTCRSSMAEAIFNNQIKKIDTLKDVFIAESAGIAAMDMQPASKNAIEAIKPWDIDLSSHRARTFSLLNINEYFLILTMTHHQKDVILSISPCSADKTFTINEYIKNTYADISDPYGLSIAEYVYTALEIKALINQLIQKLKED